MTWPRQNPADLRSGWNSHIPEPDDDDEGEDGEAEAYEQVQDEMEQEGYPHSIEEG